MIKAQCKCRNQTGGSFIVMGLTAAFAAGADARGGSIGGLTRGATDLGRGFGRSGSVFDGAGSSAKSKAATSSSASAGIAILAEHLGHGSVRPASVSFALSFWPHEEHVTEIGMAGANLAREEEVPPS